MQLIADVLEFAQDLIDEFPMRLQLLFFEGSQFHPHYQFLQDVVVAVVLLGTLLPLLELLLQLEVESEGLGVYLVQVGQEVLAEVFIIAVKGLEGEDAGDDEEDICVRALHHLSEAVVFLGDALDGA
jgi:hypothetical protein